jgi:hypothetical protein
MDVVVIVRQALGNMKLGAVVAEWQSARGRIVRRFEQLPEVEGASVVEPVAGGRTSASSPNAGASAAVSDRAVDPAVAGNG